MLKDKMTQYIAEAGQADKVEVMMYKEELEYAAKHELVPADMKEKFLIDHDNVSRFSDAYIERVHKESERLLAEETPASMFSKPIKFLKQHKEEFLYVESAAFEMIRTDGVTIELDDLFGFYNVMLGLKVQKKFEQTLKAYLHEHVQGPELSSALMFNQADGVWDLNFSLNYVEGFAEDMTIGEAFSLIYRFVFKLIEAAEEAAN